MIATERWARCMAVAIAALALLACSEDIVPEAASNHTQHTEVAASGPEPPPTYESVDLGIADDNATGSGEKNERRIASLSADERSASLIELLTSSSADGSSIGEWQAFVDTVGRLAADLDGVPRDRVMAIVHAILADSRSSYHTLRKCIVALAALDDGPSLCQIAVATPTGIRDQRLLLQAAEAAIALPSGVAHAEALLQAASPEVIMLGLQRIEGESQTAEAAAEVHRYLESRSARLRTAAIAVVLAEPDNSTSEARARVAIRAIATLDGCTDELNERFPSGHTLKELCLGVFQRAAQQFTGDPRVLLNQMAVLPAQERVFLMAGLATSFPDRCLKPLEDAIEYSPSPGARLAAAMALREIGTAATLSVLDRVGTSDPHKVSLHASVSYPVRQAADRAAATIRSRLRKQ